MASLGQTLQGGLQGMEKNMESLGERLQAIEQKDKSWGEALDALSKGEKALSKTFSELCEDLETLRALVASLEGEMDRKEKGKGGQKGDGEIATVGIQMEKADSNSPQQVEKPQEIEDPQEEKMADNGKEDKLELHPSGGPAEGGTDVLISHHPLIPDSATTMDVRASSSVIPASPQLGGPTCDRRRKAYLALPSPSHFLRKGIPARSGSSDFLQVELRQKLWCLSGCRWEVSSRLCLQSLSTRLPEWLLKYYGNAKPSEAALAKPEGSYSYSELHEATFKEERSSVKFERGTKCRDSGRLLERIPNSMFRSILVILHHPLRKVSSKSGPA
uniref:Uncharacterized protein n=1 Tax=Chromera velia CCMP2878 TaxID=1169474 RepID=A0A0G4FN41_9ALVE|eukprot:Cvel_17898.t1-p1 / transcript=Cvel_17898.t1 / gene=Cvel_17898 / organism=Chromera_velia_CCMP2878 / gene_product=hypothetical protein / transcript_product=hypothetical protein / location=Cvel_scaffold1453:9867-14745(-) / protein_length=330 / sequence_SO=supercontig / SO=protein_coding / is_pseudo=false